MREDPRYSSLCLRFLLGALLHARELMTPVLLEDAGPLVQGENRVCVGAVEHLAAIAPEAHQADVAQHLQVLRHRRLTEVELLDDVADVTLLRGEVDEDVAPLDFRNRIEDVGRGRGAGHGRELYSHYGICQAARRVPPIDVGRVPRGALQSSPRGPAATPTACCAAALPPP